MSDRLTLTVPEGASGSFELIPIGTYSTVIEDVQEKESTSEKNAGKPMYSVRFTIDGGEFDGRKLFTNICLWPEAIFSLLQLMEALGNKIKAGDELEVPTPAELVGKRVDVVVSHRTYNDQIQANVKRIIAPKGKASGKPKVGTQRVPFGKKK